MWTEACALIEQAERLHRQFFRPGLATTSTARWEPPVDVFETEGEVRIIAALPGVEPQDLEVYLDVDEVFIAGVRRLPDFGREAAVHRLEIPYGRFERRIRLSTERLRHDRTQLINGCLSLRLKKQL